MRKLSVIENYFIFSEIMTGEIIVPNEDNINDGPNIHILPSLSMYTSMINVILILLDLLVRQLII